MSRKNLFNQKEYNNLVCKVDEDTLKIVDKFVKDQSEGSKKEITVTAKWLNVRTTPEPDSFTNVKYRVANGTHLELIDEVGDWYKVKLSDNSIGYILKEFAIIV